jgi:hypothetical protein
MVMKFGKEVKNMEIKVKLQTIKITDTSSGESFSVKTIRSAKEIAGYIQESEKDEIVGKLEQEVSEVINKA